MLRQMIMQITAIHQVKNETNSVLGDEGIRHAHNEGAIGTLKPIFFFIKKGR